MRGLAWAKPVQAFPSEEGNKASEESFRVPGDPLIITRCVACFCQCFNLGRSKMSQRAPETARELTSVYVPNGNKLASLQMARDNQVNN
jgi:hypothetical protein